MTAINKDQIFPNQPLPSVANPQKSSSYLRTGIKCGMIAGAVLAVAYWWVKEYDLNLSGTLYHYFDKVAYNQMSDIVCTEGMVEKLKARGTDLTKRCLDDDYASLLTVAAKENCSSDADLKTLIQSGPWTADDLFYAFRFFLYHKKYPFLREAIEKKWVQPHMMTDQNLQTLWDVTPDAAGKALMELFAAGAPLSKGNYGF